MKEIRLQSYLLEQNALESLTRKQEILETTLVTQTDLAARNQEKEETIRDLEKEKLSVIEQLDLIEKR